MAKSTIGLPGLPVLRAAAGYTQEKLAAELGVARSTLAQWETGFSWPSAALLPKIADLLLCSIDDLYRIQPEASCNASVGTLVDFPRAKEGGV